MKQFIAVNAKGRALFDLSNPYTYERLEEKGADFSDVPNTVCDYMKSRGVMQYAPYQGFASSKYWYGGQWLPSPETAYAVFNPTAQDLENSFDNYAVSLDGKRYLLFPYTPDYQYQGTGAHTDGAPALAAIAITENEGKVLIDSPFWSIPNSTNNYFVQSDKEFATAQVEYAKMQILAENATTNEKLAAIALTKPVLELLQYAFISPAYDTLKNIAPAGVFTAELKAAILANFQTYLHKFPR